MEFNPIDPSNILLAGAGPQIRKITQVIIDKYPVLYDYANVVSVVLAFILVGVLSVLPAQVENWIKIAIAISGVTSVYSDWRSAKKAVETKDTAIAIDTAPQIVPESKGGEMKE